MPAVGVTDTANFFGALEFSEKARGEGHPADRRLQASRPLRGGGRVRGASARPAAAARGMSRRSFCSPRLDGGYRGLIQLVTEFYLGEAGRAEPDPA